MQHIYPLFEELQSEQSCYAYNCKKYLGYNKYTLPLAAIDQIIYMEDVDLYPFCSERLNFFIADHQDFLKCNERKSKLSKTLTQIWQADLEQAQYQRKAILGNRENYLVCLEARKQDFIKELEKQGIPV